MSILIDYDGAATVTQSDATADPAGPFAAFIIGGTVSGVVKLTTVRGHTVVISAAIGIIVPIAFSRIWSTGTTASLNLVGLYRLPFRGP